jgi:hypothetical protein
MDLPLKYIVALLEPVHTLPTLVESMVVIVPQEIANPIVTLMLIVILLMDMDAKHQATLASLLMEKAALVEVIVSLETV